MKLQCLVLAAALLLAPGAMAETPTASGSTGPEARPNAPAAQPASAGRRNPAARRCVDRTPIGSRLSQRECHTNAEWEEIESGAGRMTMENGAGGGGLRCDGDSSMCGGLGRGQVSTGGGS